MERSNIERKRGRGTSQHKMKVAKKPSGGESDVTSPEQQLQIADCRLQIAYGIWQKLVLSLFRLTR
jgi:hypothetical protein